MDRILKPAKFLIDPDSSTATKEWRHWVRTFRSYVNRFVSANSSQEADEDRLAALVSCATPEVFEYFDQCTTYEEAEETLERLYVKQRNEIFARYLLRTAKQGPSQTIADFKCLVVKLAKDCNFKDVTAQQYRDDLTRDAFISGLISSKIRQRLLENKTLSLKDAYGIAVTIDDARRDNRVFCKSTSGNEEPSMINSMDVEVQSTVEGTSPNCLAASASKSVCYRCGSSKAHDFRKCKAASLTCYKCNEKGHISRACRRQKHTGKGNQESSAAINTDGWVMGIFSPN